MDYWRRFKFERAGFGVYKVTYTSDRGDYWRAYIEDMTLIDRTRNAEEPRRVDWENLKIVVQCKGSHYHKNGDVFTWD